MLVNKACNFYDLVEICLGIMMIFRDYFNCNYMWTAEKIKSLLKKIKSPTVERELFQISNNLELLFVLAPTSLEQIKYLDYSQFKNVHFLELEM